MKNRIPEIINKIIKDFPYPMYWKDSCLIYRGANKAFAKCIDLKLQDIIGKTDQQLLNKDAQSKFIKINAKEDAEILKGRKSTHNEFHFPIDGKEVTLSVHKILFSDFPEQNAGMLVIYTEKETEFVKSFFEFETLDASKPVGTNEIIETLPVIDLQEGVALLNGNVTGAIGGLTLLARALPRDYQEIQYQYDAKDYSTLYRSVLKLYDGLRYCGAPALREASFVLKEAIQEQKEDLEPLMQRLREEVDRFLQEYNNLQVGQV